MSRFIKEQYLRSVRRDINTGEFYIAVTPNSAFISIEQDEDYLRTVSALRSTKAGLSEVTAIQQLAQELLLGNDLAKVMPDGRDRGTVIRHSIARASRCEFNYFLKLNRLYVKLKLLDCKFGYVPSQFRGISARVLRTKVDNLLYQYDSEDWGAELTVDEVLSAPPSVYQFGSNTQADISMRSALPRAVVICSSLNGSHGEFTGTDDLKNKGTKRQNRKQQQQANRNATRDAVRRAGVSLATPLVSREGAKDLYKLASMYAPKGSKTARRKKKMNPERSLNLGFMVLSKCVSNYIEAHINPFSLDCRSICLPNTPAVPSIKAVGFARGTAFVGTSGIGFIALMPSITNNMPSVLYTTAAYVDTNLACQPSTLSVLAAQGGGPHYPASAAFSGLPFTSNDLWAGSENDQNEKLIVGRIVAVSARLRYIGTALNQSGQMYAYTDPNNGNVCGEPVADFISPTTGYSVAQLAGKISTEITMITDRAVAEIMPLSIRPSEDTYPNIATSESQMAYPWSNGNYNGTGTSVSTGAATAAIMFTGVPAQPFWFEAIIHVEYTGPGIPSYSLTETESDSVGFDIAKNILARARDMCAADPALSYKKAIPMMMAKYKVVMGRGMRSEQR